MGERAVRRAEELIAIATVIVIARRHGEDEAS
jgi:hypothetical protein